MAIKLIVPVGAETIMIATKMLMWRPYFFDLAIAAVCLALTVLLFRWTGDINERYRTVARRAVVTAAVIILCAGVLAIYRVSNFFPNEWTVAARALGITTAGLVIYATAVVSVFRRFPAVDLRRRKLLKLAGAAAVALPAGLAAAAFIKRDNLRFAEVDIQIPGLPKDLNGLRIVQLTDIHLSPLVSESLLARAIDMANEARAAIAVVTGDLVTRRGDPLDQCLRQLARLRSQAGTFGCLGNHEIYAGAESYTVTHGNRLGLRFLRKQAEALRFGSATLNLAGVDYQRSGFEYLRRAEHLVRPDATNILLSHNPNVFDVAAARGFDVTLAGHTHGGQVNFEIIHPSLNIARFYTPYVHGLYEAGAKRLFVSRGVGTIGIPARIGSPPEVAVLRLCAT
jgi:predicted MPP superfamily phosphohydrolase